MNPEHTDVVISTTVVKRKRNKKPKKKKGNTTKTEIKETKTEDQTEIVDEISDALSKVTISQTDRPIEHEAELKLPKTRSRLDVPVAQRLIFHHLGIREQKK
jgi:hypothetical protein